MMFNGIILSAMNTVVASIEKQIAERRAENKRIGTCNTCGFTKWRHLSGCAEQNKLVEADVE